LQDAGRGLPVMLLMPLAREWPVARRRSPAAGRPLPVARFPAAQAYKR